MLHNKTFIGFSTIVRGEILRFFRIWPQTLLPSVITTSLYFFIFGSFMGDRIGAMDGVNYIQYIAPGLIMMAVITNSYGNVVGSFYSSRFQKSVEELLVSPLSNWVILLGYITGGICRGLMVALCVTGVALFFTHLKIHHFFIMILIVILTAALFSLAGFTNALFARKFDDISIIPTFVLAPLTYLGGVFYSIDLLPPFWNKLSHANPILYMVNNFRYGVLGITDINVLFGFSMVIGFIIALTTYNLYLLNKGVGIRS